MKRLLLALFILPFGLVAQTTQAPDKDAKTTDLVEKKIFTFVEKPASFPGGEKQLQNFLNASLKLTPEAKSANISGLVVAQFVIDTDGTLSDVTIVKKLGYGLDEEALRVINMFPKFIPASQNGKLVAYRYTLPVRFK